MAFFGVFMGNARARARFEARCAYLCEPILHFSLDGCVALCHGMWGDAAEPLPSPHLFLATAARGAERVSPETLARLYARYGKHLRACLPSLVSFALYDSRGGILLLGGTGGCKCYLEQTEEEVWFSSHPHLLRAPVPVDLARLRAE